MPTATAGASATARPFHLFDDWGHVQSFPCTPAELSHTLLGAFIFGFPEHHRLNLARQAGEHPDAEAVSGRWRLRREA